VKTKKYLNVEDKGKIHVKDKDSRFSFLSIMAVITAGFSTVNVT